MSVRKVFTIEGSGGYAGGTKKEITEPLLCREGGILNCSTEDGGPLWQASSNNTSAKDAHEFWDDPKICV